MGGERRRKKERERERERVGERERERERDGGGRGRCFMQCASVISDTLSRIRYRQEITSIKPTKRTFHAVQWFVKNKTSSFHLLGQTVLELRDFAVFSGKSCREVIDALKTETG